MSASTQNLDTSHIGVGLPLCPSRNCIAAYAVWRKYPPVQLAHVRTAQSDRIQSHEHGTVGDVLGRCGPSLFLWLFLCQPEAYGVAREEGWKCHRAHFAPAIHSSR